MPAAARCRAGGRPYRPSRCFSKNAIVWPMVVALHHTIWNQIHLEMHKPEGRFFANWAAYKFVARHHFLHHRYPDKNFNVAFPVGDFLCGTIATASSDDWEAMRAEGIADGPARGEARRAA